MNQILTKLSLAWRITLLALVWLALVSVAHWRLNFEHSEAQVIRMGYMPVITNLAAPLLDRASQADPILRFQALKFASFAEMGAALRNQQIEVAFMIAPLAVVLRQQGEDVKIVYIGNRHESTLVARKELGIKRVEDLAGKTVAVPMRYSGHNISMLELIKQKGLEGRIRVVEMNPPNMASALASGALDAYYVGEPFAARNLKSGRASLVHYVEEVWPNFICNLVLVRQDFIDQDPALVQTLVQGAARSGLWARTHKQEAARIAAEYWNQPLDLVKYAMDTPKNRIVFEQFEPIEQEIQDLADRMLRLGLLKKNNIDGLVESRFAQNANLQGITNLTSILRLDAPGDRK